MKIIIISAVARNGVIGRSNGEMPWHVKEEFKHFKRNNAWISYYYGEDNFRDTG